MASFDFWLPGRYIMSTHSHLTLKKLGFAYFPAARNKIEMSFSQSQMYHSIFTHVVCLALGGWQGLQNYSLPWTPGKPVTFYGLCNSGYAVARKDPSLEVRKDYATRGRRQNSGVADWHVPFCYVAWTWDVGFEGVLAYNLLRSWASEQV